jgi:hypothetical protein
MVIISNLEPVIKLNKKWNEKKNLVVTGVPYAGKTIAINSMNKTNKAAIPEIKYVSTLEEVKNILSFNKMVHIELPKNLLDEDIEEWKKVLFNVINSTYERIIEGRDYVISCIFKKKIPFNIHNNSKMNDFLQHLLSRDEESEDGYFSYYYGFNKETALKFMRSINSNVEYERDNILEYSKYPNGNNDVYIPQLIIDAINKVEEDRYSDIYFKNQVNYMTTLTLNKNIRKNSIIQQLFDIPFGSIEKIGNTEAIKQIATNLLNSSGNLASIVATGLSLANPIMLVVPVVIFGFKSIQTLRQKKMKSSIEEMMEIHRSWNNISEIRKELICYNYDQLFRLTPGTTKECLSQFFGLNKVQFSSALIKIQKDLDNLQTQFKELNEQIDYEIKKIKSEIFKLKGVILDPLQLGINVDNNKIEIEYIKKEKKFVEIIIEQELLDIEKWVDKSIEKARLVVLTGAHGIGKSVLGRYIATKKLLSQNTVLSIDNIPSDRLETILNEESFQDEFVLYDPSNVNMYLPKKEFQNSNLKELDVNTIHEKISTMINANVKGLVILPTDIWSMIHPKLNHVPILLDITNSLRNANFLKRIIETYSISCKIQDNQMEYFTSNLMEYNDGYTLIASYLGRWLNENKCIVSDINSAIENAQKEPIRFLQNYIWGAILKRDHNLARDLALPLLVHVYLGTVTSKLSSELPNSLESQCLRPLSLDLANWTSTNHEDLMELAIEKLVSPETTYKNLPELRDMLFAFNGIKENFEDNTEPIDIKILYHIQQWLSVKANKLEEKQLDEFFEYFASTLVTTFSDKEYKEKFIQYFSNDKFSLPIGSSKILFGIEYKTNDFIDYLNPTFDYGSKIHNLIEQIRKSEQEISGNLLNKLFSFVLPLSIQFNYSITSLLDALAVLSLVTRVYQRLTDRIYWKTGKRILIKCQENINNHNVATLLADYHFVLVMISVINPEQSAKSIFMEFAKKFKINEIINNTTIIRLSKFNSNIKEFQNTIEILSQKQDPDNISLNLFILLAGYDISSFYQYQNISSKANEWYNRMFDAITQLRKIDISNQIITDWITPTLYLSKDYNKINNTHLENALTNREIDVSSYKARIAYRENRIDDTINILEACIKKN